MAEIQAANKHQTNYEEKTSEIYVTPKGISIISINQRSIGLNQLDPYIQQIGLPNHIKLNQTKVYQLKPNLWDSELQ